MAVEQVSHYNTGFPVRKNLFSFWDNEYRDSRWLVIFFPWQYKRLPLNVFSRKPACISWRCDHIWNTGTIETHHLISTSLTQMQSTALVLNSAERGKLLKVSVSCELWHNGLTPLIISSDGVMAVQMQPLLSVLQFVWIWNSNVVTAMSSVFAEPR